MTSHSAARAARSNSSVTRALLASPRFFSSGRASARRSALALPEVLRPDGQGLAVVRAGLLDLAGVGDEGLVERAEGGAVGRLVLRGLRDRAGMPTRPPRCSPRAGPPAPGRRRGRRWWRRHRPGPRWSGWPGCARAGRSSPRRAPGRRPRTGRPARREPEQQGGDDADDAHGPQATRGAGQAGPDRGARGSAGHGEPGRPRRGQGGRPGVAGWGRGVGTGPSAARKGAAAGGGRRVVGPGSGSSRGASGVRGAVTGAGSAGAGPASDAGTGAGGSLVERLLVEVAGDEAAQLVDGRGAPSRAAARRGGRWPPRGRCGRSGRCRSRSRVGCGRAPRGTARRPAGSSS